MERTKTTSHQNGKSNRHIFSAVNGHAESEVRGFGGKPGDARAMIDRLNSDLLHARNENRQLVDALRSLHSQFNSLQMHADKQSDLLLYGGEELQEAKQRLIALQREQERAQKVQARMQECGDDAKDLGKVEENNAALKARLKELEQYIDGHKGGWAESDHRLRDYHDALAGMEQEIKDWKDAAKEQEQNNAELALKIVSLERRCAELDGRRAERESAYEELRATFDMRSKEIEQLNLNVSRMQKAFADLAGNGPGELNGSAHRPNAVSEAISAAPVTGAAQPDAGNDKPAKPWWYAEENEDVTRWTAGAKPEPDTSTNGVVKDAVVPRFMVMPIGGKQSESHYPLDKKVITIGRSRANDIPVASDCVSRVHARIIQTGSRVIIEDMGSRNGLLVNAKPIRYQALKHGDTFTIGYRDFELFDTRTVRLAVPAD